MHDVIIIGRGPAGISASIYTARAGLKTLVLGRESKMENEHPYDNYFGCPDVTGKQLLERGVSQAEKFGAEIKNSTVVSAKKTENFTVETDAETETSQLPARCL